MVAVAAEDGDTESQLGKLLLCPFISVCETADPLIRQLNSRVLPKRDLFCFFSIRQKLKTAETSLMGPDHGDFRTKDVGQCLPVSPKSPICIKAAPSKSPPPLPPLPPFCANPTISHTQ